MDNLDVLYSSAYRAQTNIKRLDQYLKHAYDSEKELSLSPIWFVNLLKKGRLLIEDLSVKHSSNLPIELGLLRYDIIISNNEPINREKTSLIKYRWGEIDKNIAQKLEPGTYIHDIPISEITDLATDAEWSLGYNQPLKGDKLSVNQIFELKGNFQKLKVVPCLSGYACAIDIYYDIPAQALTRLLKCSYTKSDKKDTFLNPTASKSFIDEVLIYDKLKTHLPDYLIPKHLVQVNYFPLTKNGKVDLSSLLQKHIPKKVYDTPSSSNEHLVHDAFAEVLQQNDIDIETDFFKIGGNSLSALEVIAKLNKYSQHKLKLSEFYKRRTIKKLAAYISKRDTNYAEQKSSANIDHNPLLTHQQKMVYFFSLHNEIVPQLYNIIFSIRVESSVHKNKILKALNCTLNDHMILKGFVKKRQDSEPLLGISDKKLEVKHLIFSTNDEFLNWLDLNKKHVFNLDKPPLINAYLCEHSDLLYIIFVAHHMILDEKSVTCLLKEIVERYYNNLTNSIDSYDYIHYAKTSKANIPNLDKLKYALLQTDGNHTLPSDHIYTKHDYSGATSTFYIDNITEKVDRVARDLHCTPFIVLCSVFYAVAFRLLGQKELTVGVPFGNRDSEYANAIGYFTNVVPLPVKLDHEEVTFSDLIEKVKSTFELALEYQDISLSEILSVLPETMHSRDYFVHPLFQMLFSMSAINSKNVGNIIQEINFLPTETAKFPITLHCTFVGPNRLQCNWEYLTGWYSEDLIATFHNIYANFLSQVLGNINIPLSQLEYLKENTQRYLMKQLTGLTKNVKPPELNKAILCKQNSLNIAIKAKDGQINFKKLVLKANQIKSALNYFKSPQKVGIALSRGIDCFATIYACVIGGITYVPFSSSWPEARKKQIIDQANLQAIIMGNPHSTESGWSAYKLHKGIYLHLFSKANRSDCEKDSNILYEIYTSGTSGLPKPASIHHSSVRNLLDGMIKNCHLNNTTKIAQAADLGFDMSVPEIFLGVILGAETIIIPDEILADSIKLINFLDSSDITIIQLTPNRLELLIEQGWRNINNITILCGGDLYSDNLLYRLNNLDWEVWNIYGPTETTVWATAGKLNQNNMGVSVGKPFQNVSCAILDSEEKLLPPGVKGELYINGINIMVNNSFVIKSQVFNKSTLPQDILSQPFKTGDLASYDNKGNIYIHGRNDSLLKFLGYRVAAEEVNSLCLQEPSIINSRCFVKQTSKMPVLCVALQVSSEKCNREQKLVNELCNSLELNLPHYMLPKHFVITFCPLPTTVNGKVDISTLVSMPFFVRNDGNSNCHQYVPKKFLELVGDTIGLNDVCSSDNFFYIGGNSLNAVDLAKKLSNHFGVRLAPIDILKTPLLYELYYVICSSNQNNSKSLLSCGESRHRERPYKLHLLKHEESLLAHAQASNKPHIYNVYSVKQLPFTIKETKDNLTAIVYNQLMLQATVNMSKLEFTFSRNSTSIDFKSLKINNEEDLKVYVSVLINTNFLNRKHLWCYRIINLQGKYFHFLVGHHIILDGTSVEIIWQQMQNEFKLKKSQPIYKDIINLRSKLFATHKQYWEGRLNTEALRFASYYPISNQKKYSGKYLLKHFDSQKIAQLSGLIQASDFSTLIAIFSVLLSLFCRTNKFNIGILVDIRTIKYTVSEIVGNLTNIMPVPININKSQTLIGIIKSIAQSITSSYAYADTSFEDILELNKFNRLSNSDAGCQVIFGEQSKPYEEFFNNKCAVHNKTAKYPLSIFFIRDASSQKFDHVFYELSDEILPFGFVQYLNHCFYILIDELLENKNLLLSDIKWSKGTQYANHESQTRISYEIFQEQSKQVFDYDFLIHLKQLGQKIAFNHPNKNKSVSYLSLAKKVLNFSSNFCCQNISGVALILPQEPDTIMLMISLLMSGIPYIYISPQEDTERINNILKNIPSINMVISSSKDLHNSFHSIVTHNILLNDFVFNDDLSTADSDLGQHGDFTDNSIAFYTTTSGTTGLPKVIQVTQGNLYNFLNWAQTNYRKEEVDQTLAITPWSFDIHVMEIFLPLLHGGTIHIADSFIEVLNNPEILKPITFFNSVPSTAESLLSLIKSLKNVKVFNFAGEVLNPRMVNKLPKNAKVYNLYGPAETTVAISCEEISLPVNEQKYIPIGHAIDHNVILICDTEGAILPPYAVGEIIIVGASVTKGYHSSCTYRFNNNLKKYEQLPVYKTGDVGWQDGQGKIYFYGREDDEVKIRGQRANLKGVEYALKEIEWINSVVVIFNENKEGMIAFYTKHVNGAQSNEEIKKITSKLKKRLPEYAIPIEFVLLGHFPINKSGKVDMSLLSQWGRQKRNFLNSFASARVSCDKQNENVKQLTEIWSNVLNIQKLDTNKGFFEQGGSSLKLLRLYNRLQEYYPKTKIELIDLLQNTTISQQANFLDNNLSEDGQESPAYTSSSLNNFKESAQRSQKIAIIGYAFNFGGIKTDSELWHLIYNKQNKISKFTPKQLQKMGVNIGNPHQTNYHPVSGYVPEIEYFDNNFFGLSNKEAKQLDPNYRVSLEVLADALHKSGINFKNHSDDTTIGICCGMSESNGLTNLYGYADSMLYSSYNSPGHLSSRLSYILGFNGPAISVDTACSTGLASIINAINYLNTGVADVMCAGASSLIAPSEIGYLFQDGSIFSPSETCKPFDINADGTIPGAGCGYVILKRLDDAVENNDPIYAVVDGYSINNDGNNKLGYASPSVDRQTENLKKAFANRKASSTLNYIEAHGTGTNLGDTMELKSIESFLKLHCGYKVPIGSIKANVGHAGYASGIAGLMKAILIGHKKIVPPLTHFNSPNKNINSEFIEYPKESQCLSGEEQITALVNSLGIGGTNTSVILEVTKDCSASIYDQSTIKYKKNYFPVRNNDNNILSREETSYESLWQTYFGNNYELDMSITSYLDSLDSLALIEKTNRFFSSNIDFKSLRNIYSFEEYWSEVINNSKPSQQMIS